ncbi:cyclin-dependent kinases regulatory subunit [Teleopsis dalmanni]|uniref:cyclin-dependent kinases regulatory subunit n=1 Tax=Teleopsis dalmanni TaxID=139649 RepID=UPI0018CD37E6|nr:cyclin-dependent kinases regulatory subunit [Teleopsis dalmanni]
MPNDQILYSEKYYDDIYEYRHVILPGELSKSVPKSHLMTETEWRNLGVQQSAGWVHFMIHNPEPHILLFRRPRTDNGEATSQAATGSDAVTNNE